MPSPFTVQRDDNDTSPFVMSLRTAYLCSLLITWTAVRAQECRPTYFGDKCHFKCHCKRGLCEKDGKCPDDLCQVGFFGPKCQYVDLLTGESSLSNPSYLQDNNEETCNPNPEEQLVYLDLNRPVILYWIRVYVNKPFVANEDAPPLKLTMDRDGQCTDKHVYIGQNYIDITCSAILMYKFSLEGKIVGSFCSLYFSGGRNIAIGQRASSSSTWQLDQEKAGADNAVDGNKKNDFQTSTSCTRTDSEPSGPTWSVNFNYPQIVFNVEILTDKDEKDELGRFRLTALNSAGAVVYTYDHDKDEVDAVTNVSPFPQEPISSISIQQMANVTNRVLTLCEVQVFAETICPDGYFGLSCKDICTCKYSNMCRTATGLCMAHESLTVSTTDKPDAKPVFEECPSGTYGANCTMLCPAYCTLSYCDQISGNCTECDKSHRGAKCEECANSKYGPACSQQCPDGCLDSCEMNTGKCFKCKESFEGPMCEKTKSSRILIMTATIVFTCLAVFVVLTYLLRKSKKKPGPDSESDSSSNTELRSSI